MNKRWDIFCKIVDNFGDIGVCWRLARQLQREYGLQVRLWIDDLAVAQKLIPALDTSEASQVCNEINILKWHAEDDFSQAADVVIEAFGCELPAPYLTAMARQQSKWINLEYLSAESWVEDFHGKPSPQANGLKRYFYFPGFTEKTGGLIREADILPCTNSSSKNIDCLKVSLFCYPNAPIHDLLTALQANKQAVHVFLPISSIAEKVAEFFGKTSLQIGEKITQKNLTVEVLPFLSQTDYDQLLSACDLNFVRGEDSWVRAIWAGKPFIWQPYVQADDAHLQKLNAFLDFFYADFDQKQLACQAHRYWSTGQLPKDVLSTYLNNLTTIAAHTQRQANQLAQQPDLAAKLMIFCKDL